jgi:hypothetical protein
MTRTYPHASLWRLLAALLVLAALATLLRPVGAQPGTPGHEPLVPNIEPAEAGLAIAGPPSEAEAVAAALAAYAALPQPAMPPAGALLEMPAQAALGAAISATNPVYLPLIIRAPAIGQAPPPATPTPVTPTPEPDEPADVAVVLWARPSIWVARGALLEYEIRLANYGEGSTGGINVVLPYYRSQYTLAYTGLDSKKGDWVSRIDQNSFTLHFGPLSDGARRGGKIFLRVNNSLPQQTLLNVRALYSFESGGGEGRLSNWAPVLVGSGPADSPYVWVAATPDRGPAGTKHSISSNRFAPGEEVSTWLNTPQGVRPLSLRGTADAQGSLTLSYASSGLARGSYQIVLYGNRSGLTGVASLIVQ